MSGENEDGTFGCNHGTLHLRSRQCYADMPCVAKMTIHSPPTATPVSRDGYLVDLNFENIIRLQEHEVASVRHAASNVARDLSGQFAPRVKTGTNA